MVRHDSSSDSSDSSSDGQKRRKLEPTADGEARKQRKVERKERKKERKERKRARKAEKKVKKAKKRDAALSSLLDGGAGADGADDEPAVFIGGGAPSGRGAPPVAAAAASSLMPPPPPRAPPRPPAEAPPPAETPAPPDARKPSSRAEFFARLEAAEGAKPVVGTFHATGKFKDADDEDGEEDKSGDWACQRCSYVNFKECMTCARCRSLRRFEGRNQASGYCQ